ncbi:MAG: hypothetical protein R3346_01115 [Candidatus Spechtbacterales bacterium]|nr:hypothetical protein [Candidatus Spechtbacterales bacterium]
MKNLLSENGMGIIEIIVVVAIILSAFVAILQLTFLERRAQIIAREDIEAYMLARESLEATRSIRDDSWANLSSLTYDIPYYVVINTNVWEITATDPGPVNGYDRWVEVSQVFRDANDDITTSGGVSDPDTLEVTSYVEWTTAGGNTRQVDMKTYLTNWQEYR